MLQPPPTIGMSGRCAAAATVCALVVVVASALIRHLTAGAACADWPACYGRPLLADMASAAPVLHLARLTHRVASGMTLVLVLAMTVLAWRSRTARRRELRLSLAALLVTLALAMLGAMTGASRVPAVAVTNLVGGFLLLAVVACALPQRRPDAFAETPRLLFVALLASIGIQVLVGAFLAAHRLLTTCPIGEACPWSWNDAASSSLWNLLDTRERVDAPAMAAAALMHRVHGMVGIAVLLGGLVLAGTHTRGGRRLAWSIGTAAVLGPICGLLASGTSRPLVAIMLHNAIAALLCATVARGLLQSQPAGAAVSPALTSDLSGGT